MFLSWHCCFLACVCFLLLQPSELFLSPSLEVSQYWMVFNFLLIWQPILRWQEFRVNWPNYLLCWPLLCLYVFVSLARRYIDNSDAQGRSTHACCLARMLIFASFKILCGETNLLQPSNINWTLTPFLYSTIHTYHNVVWFTFSPTR